MNEPLPEVRDLFHRSSNNEPLPEIRDLFHRSSNNEPLIPELSFIIITLLNMKCRRQICKYHCIPLIRCNLKEVVIGRWTALLIPQLGPKNIEEICRNLIRYKYYKDTLIIEVRGGRLRVFLNKSIIYIRSTNIHGDITLKPEIFKDIIRLREKTHFTNFTDLIR